MNAEAKSSAKHTAMKGSLWTLGGYGASQVIRLASNLILAHLLFPAAFGLMALVNVFMQGLEMLSDIGIGPSVIQNKRGTEPKFLRTAWTLQIIRGLILWLVSVALAKPAAHFFAARDPLAEQLTTVLPVAGLMALLGGFASTSLFTLNRKMEMRKLTIVTLGPQVVTLMVSIAWAFIDRSVWAIVAGGLAGSLARLVMSHAINPGPRDRMGWDAEAARELEKFGRWVFASTLVAFLSSNLDRVVLGRLLSLSELGLYSIGMTFARVATQVSTRLTNTVVFPLLSKYQDQPARLMTFALRARAAVLWAGGAVCAGFAIFAPSFFDTLYDNRYAGAGRISQWLSLYVWAWILTATIERIPLALGQPRALFNANVAGAIAIAVAGVGYKIAALPGFIVGYAIAELASFATIVAAIPASRGELVRQSAFATAAVAAYALPVLTLLGLLDPQLPKWASVVAHGLFAAAPGLLAAWMVRRMMEERSVSPELQKLAADVSARRAEMAVLRERGTDVLIARTKTADGRAVIVKLWNRRGIRGFLRRFSGTHIARREWDALRLLRKGGLGVPEPIACFTLQDPSARHTDVLIEEDLGACRDATEEYKAMLKEGRLADAADFEEHILRSTEVMLRQGFVDTDHRLPNFVVRPDGLPVRLDFELARRVRNPRREDKDLGLMLGALVGSYIFAVQPDAARAENFARRVAERLAPSAGALRIARERIHSMLQRQKREIGLDTIVEIPW